MINLQYLPSQIINFDEVLDVIRFSNEKYVDGKPTKTPNPPFKIQANVQPLNGRELLIVPEAERFKEMYYIFTTGFLRVDDEIVRLGINLTVQIVETWGNYQRARVTRIDVGTNASD